MDEPNKELNLSHYDVEILLSTAFIDTEVSKLKTASHEYR